jgi:hypothetical protein
MGNKNNWLDAGIERMTKKPAYAKANTTILKNALPEKISAVLLNFAKPLLDTVDLTDDAVTKSTIMMAVTIWNYSIIIDGKAPKGIVDTALQTSIKTAVKSACQGPIGERVLFELLNRKKALYPDNYKIIGDFDINWNKSKTEFHLTVLTTD